MAATSAGFPLPALPVVCEAIGSDRWLCGGWSDRWQTGGLLLGQTGGWLAGQTGGWWGAGQTGGWLLGPRFVRQVYACGFFVLCVRQVIGPWLSDGQTGADRWLYR